MATPYSVIIDRALQKITDTDLLMINFDVRDKIFESYLTSSVVGFQRISKVDLSQRDDDAKEFLEDLDDEVIEILATGIVYEWIKPKVNNTENLRNALSTKDFSTFSPANLLSQLQQLRDSLYKDFRRMCIAYSYHTLDFDSIRSK